MAPVTRSWSDLGLDGGDPDLSVLNEEQRQRLMNMAGSGETWFRGLTPEQQSRILGPGRYAAWQDGAFQFSQLSTPYTDRVYGQMWRAASLQELVGKQMAEQYKRLRYAK